MRLLEASGWSQAEAARQLGMTRGGVNQIVSGRNEPSAQTVRLFKMILAGEKPEAVSAAGSVGGAYLISEDAAEYGLKLSRLPAPDAAAVKQIIDRLESRPTAEVNSTGAPLTPKDAARAALEAMKRKRMQRSKAGAPSGKGGSPGEGAEHGSSGRRSHSRGRQK